MHITLRIAFATLLACGFTAPAHAGQLFPPGGLANGDPKENCPDGTSLSWNGAAGTVECTNTKWQNVPMDDQAPFQLGCEYMLGYKNPYWNNAPQTTIPTFIFTDQICMVENGGPTYTCIKASDKRRAYHTSDGQILNFYIESIHKLCR